MSENSEVFSADLQSALAELSGRFGQIGDDAKDGFDGQVRNVPKAHRLKGRIIRLSKDGITAIHEERWEDIQFILDESQKLFQELYNLDLPGDNLWQFDAQAGQEMAELFVFANLYPFLTNTTTRITSILHFTQMNVTAQSWAYGAVDALGELWKVMETYNFARLSGSYKDKVLQKIAFNERLLAIQQMVLDKALDILDDTPPAIGNNSRFRGPGQSLHSRIKSVRYHMDSTRRAISELKDKLEMLVAMKS